jgi:hypothetical protein
VNNDRYLSGILTVIAILLFAILFKDDPRPAEALNELGTRLNPYVITLNVSHSGQIYHP